VLFNLINRRNSLLSSNFLDIRFNKDTGKKINVKQGNGEKNAKKDKTLKSLGRFFSFERAVNLKRGEIGIFEDVTFF